MAGSAEAGSLARIAQEGHEGSHEGLIVAGRHKESGSGMVNVAAVLTYPFGHHRQPQPQQLCQLHGAFGAVGDGIVGRHQRHVRRP